MTPALNMFRIFRKTPCFIIPVLLLIISCTPPGLYRTRVGNLSGSRKRVIHTAKRYLGVKYKWGGITPSGFDCSGYTMYVYRKSGYKIPRALMKQFRSGRRIPLNRARPGDLIFFNISGKRISHVGLYMGNYRFIHAPRTGKTVSYADMRKRYWRRRYRGTITYF